MTEQHQIEEIAKVIGNTWLVDLEGDTKDACEVLDEVDIKGIARELYEQSYRKIPKDSVVLSREEYERLKLELAIEKKRADESYTQKEVEEIIASKERIKSKEIAEKIYTFVNSFGTHNWERFEEFIKQFGVKIKE